MTEILDLIIGYRNNAMVGEGVPKNNQCEAVASATEDSNGIAVLSCISVVMDPGIDPRE